MEEQGALRAALDAAARGRAANVLPLIRQMQARGVRTLAALAAELNSRGVQSARGGMWHAMTVRNVLGRGVGQ